MSCREVRVSATEIHLPTHIAHILDAIRRYSGRSSRSMIPAIPREGHAFSEMDR